MINDEEIFKLIGNNMKYIRKNIAHKTQEEFAKELGMSRSFISQIESPNVYMKASLTTLIKIAIKYNFDIRLFFENYENISKSK